MPLLTNTQSTRAGSVIRLYRDRFRIAPVAITVHCVASVILSSQFSAVLAALLVA